MYVGMVAAVILAERDRVAELADTSPVAPVIVVQPALELDAIMLRSDL